MLQRMSISRHRLSRALALAAVGAFLAAVRTPAAEPAWPPSWVEVARIELPGVAGRIDHLAIDPDRQRLFAAAVAADEVAVVDLRAGQLVAQLRGLRGAQGVVRAGSPGRLFVAAGESGEVVAYDGETRVAAAGGLPDADNLRFFAPGHLLVAGHGHALALIDPKTMAVLERFPLPGHPEAFELAEHGPAIYVNVPDVGRVVVLDRRSGKTVAEWPVSPAASNYPMALDETAHRLYVGTRHPARLLVFDTASGHRLAEQPSCGDADDLFLDAPRSRLIAICGEGAVDVFDTRAPGAPRPVQRLVTSPGARTGGYVASNGTLYVAAPASRVAPARVLVFQLASPAAPK